MRPPRREFRIPKFIQAAENLIPGTKTKKLDLITIPRLNTSIAVNLRVNRR